MSLSQADSKQFKQNSEPCQTSWMARFSKVDYGYILLIIFVKRSILDVGQGPEYASAYSSSYALVYTRKTFYNNSKNLS